MVMSIGWNPFFKNKERTAEPWILHEFEEPFYGQELRLVVCGYIRLADLLAGTSLLMLHWTPPDAPGP